MLFRSHDSVEVRTTAIETLAALRGESVPRVVRSYLDDRDPRVVAAAAVALAQIMLVLKKKQVEKVQAAEGI